MSVEAISPAENHLDELAAGLIDCARAGSQLAQQIHDLQQQHEDVIKRQIELARAVDGVLARECHDGNHRDYVRGLIAEKIRRAIYPEQIAAGAEPPTAPPELYIVQEGE